MDLCEVCSNYAPVAKMALCQVSPGTWSVFYRYLYVNFKQNSGEPLRAIWPSCSEGLSPIPWEDLGWGPMLKITFSGYGHVALGNVKHAGKNYTGMGSAF